MLPLAAMAAMAKLRSFLFLGFAFFTNVNRRTHYFWTVEGVSINS